MQVQVQHSGTVYLFYEPDDNTFGEATIGENGGGLPVSLYNAPRPIKKDLKDDLWSLMNFVQDEEAINYYRSLRSVEDEQDED